MANIRLKELKQLGKELGVGRVSTKKLCETIAGKWEVTSSYLQSMLTNEKLNIAAKGSFHNVVKFYKALGRNPKYALIWVHPRKRAAAESVITGSLTEKSGKPGPRKKMRRRKKEKLAPQVEVAESPSVRRQFVLVDSRVVSEGLLINLPKGVGAHLTNTSIVDGDLVLRIALN